MKQVMKRLTALLLAGIMIISMIPELTVKAAGNANIQCVFKCGANVTGVLDITGTLTLTGTSFPVDCSYMASLVINLTFSSFTILFSPTSFLSTKISFCYYNPYEKNKQACAGKSFLNRINALPGYMDKQP